MFQFPDATIQPRGPSVVGLKEESLGFRHGWAHAPLVDTAPGRSVVLWAPALDLNFNDIPVLLLPLLVNFFCPMGSQKFPFYFSLEPTSLIL